MKVNEAVLIDTVTAYAEALKLKISRIKERANRYHLNEATKVLPSQLKELRNLFLEFERFLSDNDLINKNKDQCKRH